jgi:hypothetical protein
MLKDQTCCCSICKVEQTLALKLNETGSGDWFEVLKAKFPTLIRFESALDLIDHLHSRTQENSDASADKILSALIHASAADGSHTFAQDLLILAFVPALHKTYREICVFFPSLSSEDVAQQVLTTFLEVIRFSSLERRNSHLSVAIARKVRNFAFRWAVKETQNLDDSEPVDGPPPAPPEPVAEGDVETSYALREFLAHCCRIGTLTSSELSLLVKLKLEGFEAKEVAKQDGKLSPKAVQRRFEKIIARLRRCAR